MKKENDEIIDLFRSRLEYAELPVEDALWDSLEKEIPVIMHHRRRLMLHRFTAAASVLLILAVSSAAFWYLSPKEEIADAFTQVTLPTPQATLGTDGVKIEIPPIAEATFTPKPASNSSALTLYKEEEEEETISFSFSMSFSFSTSSENVQDDIVSNSRTNYDRELKNDESIADKEKEMVVDENIQVAKKRTWAVGVAASTGLSAKENNISHKMPLSIGINIQKELSPVIALESGLTYTQLNSDITVGDMKDTQKLHYIGIPLKANITLHDTKRIKLYASGGGMIEKCISGPTDAFQASLSAGLGLQCKLNDRLSLYAEPGISYHFDNGSSVPTLRKEKPLNMNLLCGVRMTY
ncbi:porin family protein [Bacteroides sp. 224]|uniref:porin family protein n=1 Tax=Bacteroides sp. 224 TaxID=2302936 RepID=UPI0013D1664E|nr:porin family protein [Bacteroides sp. 224]NDV66624.1 porin family protein [Bacteroides sp. 224]